MKKKNDGQGCNAMLQLTIGEATLRMPLWLQQEFVEELAHAVRMACEKPKVDWTYLLAEAMSTHHETKGRYCYLAVYILALQKAHLMPAGLFARDGGEAACAKLAGILGWESVNWHSLNSQLNHVLDRREDGESIYADEFRRFYKRVMSL